MPTHREMLNEGGRPFFERMVVLRQLFKRFEETEDHRGGVFQDAEIELRVQAAQGAVSDYAPDSLMEYGIETCIIETMHRLCQIVLLYSTFESLCRGTLGTEASMRIDASLIRCAAKRANDDRR